MSDSIVEVQTYTPRVRRKTAPRRRVSMKIRGSGRIKPKGVSKLKKQLDNLFSKYIRGKYAKKCFTCPYVGNLQCGHFVSRMYLATRWDENNCRPQCAMCNLWGRGMVLDFEENLIKEIGKDEVEFLKAKRKVIWKLTPSWYEAEIIRYTDLLNNLLIKRG